MASATGIKAGSAYVELTANDSALAAGLKRAQAKLAAFSAGITKIGSAFTKAATVSALPVALSAKVFGSFRDQMAIVQAVTNATDKDFGKLTDRAKELGRTTSFTASEVASAMVALGRAGFSTDEILSSIAGTLDLARAGAIDLGEATTIMADISRSFGLTADEAGRVGDVLAKTANVSNTDVKLVGDSMKYVAASANLSGQKLERVSAALAVLANRGLKGEMAGASMAMALSQLAGEDVQKDLAGMGVAVTDAQGNMRDLLDILRDLGKATSGMGNAEKLATFKKMFDQRGMRSMILLSENVDEWEKLTGVVKESGGTAATVAKKMDDTLGGSFRMLMSAVEGVQIALGEALDKTFRQWMDYGIELAGRITAIIEANRGFVISAVKIIAVVGAVGGALLAAGTAGSALAFVVGGLGSIVSALTTTIGLLGAVLGAVLSPVGLVAAAIAGLGLYILYATGTGEQALGWLGDAFESLKARVTAVLGAIRDALAAGDLALAAKILWLALKVEWEKGIGYLNLQWETLYVTAADALDRIATTAAEVWDTVYAAALDALGKVETLVLQVGNAIASAFWSAIQKVMDGFATLADKVLTAGYALHLVDDKELVQMDRALRAMREGVAATSDHSSTFYEKRIAEVEERRQTRGQELNQRTIGREQDLAGRKQTRDQAYTQDLLAAEEAVRQARAEYESAVAEAAQKRSQAESAPGEAPASAVDTLLEKLKGAGAAAADAIAKVTEVRGTFSAEAILGLQASGTEERTARAAEETARNTKRLVDEAALGGLTFG